MNLAQTGFEPGAFKSSRAGRSQFKQQSVEDFLDTDELEERSKTSLTVKVCMVSCAQIHAWLGQVPETCMHACWHLGVRVGRKSGWGRSL